MSLMHPEQLPPEPRQFPVRLVVVAVIGVILFALAALDSAPPAAPMPPPVSTASPAAAVNALAAPTAVSLRGLAANPPRPENTVPPAANALNIICDGSSTPAPLITPGQPVSGELNGCGTALFTIAARAGDRLTIRLHVPNGNTYLSLHDAIGAEIADDPIDTDRPNALLETTIATDGIYTLYARDLRSRNIAFTLTATIEPGT